MEDLMALNISSGVKLRSQRVVIYGPEGIGKTTMASKFDDPLFIDTENGSEHLDVKRLDKPKSWGDLLAVVKEVAKTPDVCRTLILDTADWAEALCIDYVCKKHNQNSIEAFGYGKGYVYVMEEWQKLLKAFDEVIRAGITVVMTAHAKMRKFEQPDEIGAYDRWEMKLSRQVAPLVKEWCDCLLFLNYKTTVVTDQNGHAKAQGGKRWLYTTHNPCWDAKNRLGLNEDMELNSEEIASIFKTLQNKAPEEQKDKKPFPLWDLMQRDHITEDEIVTVCETKKFCVPGTKFEDFSEELQKFLVDGWENVIKLVEADRKLPF
jgi:hypothetical protein